MPGATAVLTLLVSSTVSFATVIGLASVAPQASVPLGAEPSPLPFTRPPPPQPRPLDDRQPAGPVPMHEAEGELIYCLDL